MKFKVSFYYEESGVVEVEANSRKEAEDKLYAELDSFGLDRICEKRKVEDGKELETQSKNSLCLDRPTFYRTRVRIPLESSA